MRTTILALALALAAPAAAPALAEEVPLTELKKSLAEKNYYPSLEGLTSAQADVKCNILDQVVAAFPDAAGQPIAVKYYFSRPSLDVAPRKKFDISGVPDGLTDLTNRAKQIFMGKEDLPVNAPVYETIETTDATAVNDGGRITVTGVARNPSDQIKKLNVEIDAATWQVRRMTMDLGEAKADISMTNKDLGGKWGVESTEISTPQVKQIMKFEYTQAGGFWLPSKITLDYQGPDGASLSPTFVYEFSNWKVNEGLPEGTL